MTYKDLNRAYRIWQKYPTPAAMERLMDRVIKFVIIRYRRTDSAYKDIAQESALAVWRTLLGDLKRYDPARGEFAAHVVGIAISQRKMFYRSDRLLLVESDIMEKLQHNRGLRYNNPQDPLSFELPVEK